MGDEIAHNILRVVVTNENLQPESASPVTPDAVATPNPMEGLGVNVYVPDIEVRMVNAGALEEYEIWFGSASVLVATTVGFLVAYIQSFSEKDTHGNSIFLVVTILFFVFFLGAACRASILRLRIRRKSRSYPMRVTSV